MEITEVKVFPIREAKLKAFVSIVLDGCFMINDIKIIHGRDGRFISMPSRRKKNGEFKDVAHPLNSETRAAMTELILAEYDRRVDAPEKSSLDGSSDGSRDASESEGGEERDQNRDDVGLVASGADRAPQERSDPADGGQEPESDLGRLQEDLLREDEWAPPEPTASGGAGS